MVALCGWAPSVPTAEQAKGTRVDTMPKHHDEELLNRAELQRHQPHHSLGAPGGVPSGPWKTWLDVPLVLRAPEVQVLLNVSRSTAYAAMRDGTIPSFRVRNTLR